MTDDSGFLETNGARIYYEVSGAGPAVAFIHAGVANLRMWDEQAVIVSEMVRKRGNTITALSQDEATRWQQTTRPVIDNLNAALKDKNIDGAKLLESFQALVAKYDKTV